MKRSFTFLSLAALAALLALPAMAGSLTVTSGPTYSPPTAFAGSTITVQTIHQTTGDVVSLTGDVTITPPAIGDTGNDSISFTASFTANPGDQPTVGYSFTVNSTDPRSFAYTVSGTAMVGGFPEVIMSQGTITPGMHTYSDSAMAPAPFPSSVSGTFTGQLTITPIIQLPRGGNPSGAAGTLALSITQGDFSVTGGAVTVTPAHMLNISSRAMVMGGDQDAIAGFIITGSVPKRVIVRGIGPSLPDYVTTKLGDPTINLMNLTTGTAVQVAMNDNWKDTQEAEITATGLAPTNDLESAIVATLDPGTYSAQLSGTISDRAPAAIPSGSPAVSSGIGLIEVYDLDPAGLSTVANLSTRAMVLTDDNALIGGVIIGGTANATVVARAIGPSMSMVTGILADPTLELYDSNGTSLAFNDDWQTDENSGQLGGLAPTDPKESALYRVLAPGNYTAVVRGKDGTTGVGLVEFYLLQQAN